MQGSSRLGKAPWPCGTSTASATSEAATLQGPPSWRGCVARGLGRQEASPAPPPAALRHPSLLPSCVPSAQHSPHTPSPPSGPLHLLCQVPALVSPPRTGLSQLHLESPGGPKMPLPEALPRDSDAIVPGVTEHQDFPASQVMLLGCQGREPLSPGKSSSLHPLSPVRAGASKSCVCLWDGLDQSALKMESYSSVGQPLPSPAQPSPGPAQNVWGWERG